MHKYTNIPGEKLLIVVIDLINFKGRKEERVTMKKMKRENKEEVEDKHPHPLLIPIKNKLNEE